MLIILIANFLKKLLNEASGGKPGFIEVFNLLFNKSVDPRQLAFMKIAFGKFDHASTGKLNRSQFLQVYRSSLKFHMEDTELFEAIFKYVSDNEEAIFDRVNDLVDAYHYYPLIVKKDKNHSSSMYQILNANKPYDPTRI